MFTKGPRPPHTMTHDPVYPVMTFSEFLASKTYLGGKKNFTAQIILEHFIPTFLNYYLFYPFQTIIILYGIIKT